MVVSRSLRRALTRMGASVFLERKNTSWMLEAIVKNGKLRVENGKCGGGRPGEVKLLNKDVFLDEESATKAFAKFCNAKFFKGNCCGCPIVKHKNCSIAFMFTAVEGSAK